MSEIRREAEAYAHRSDERGRLAGHVLSLLGEVEQLRAHNEALMKEADATEERVRKYQAEDERRYLMLRDVGNKLADAVEKYRSLEDKRRAYEGALAWSAILDALSEWRKFL